MPRPITTQPVDPGVINGPDVPSATNGGVTGPLPPPTATPSAASWLNDPQFSGMDPALRQIYQQGNLSPSGLGSGFADWQYWQGKGPSQYQRLTNDIAGTGTDQPTGTPGTGPWQNSGRGQMASGMGQQSSQADSILSQFESLMNQYVAQLMAQGMNGGQAGGGQGSGSNGL